MMWVGIVVGSLAGIVALMAVAGAMLPVCHTATRRARFRQPPETIWSALTDVDAFPTWRPDLRKVERLGDGRWREIGRHGTMTLETVEQEPPRRLVGRIADKNPPFGGSWTYQLTTADGGTELVITENGQVYNPLFRFMSKFLFGHAATLEEVLRALGRKFGEEVRVGP